MFGYQAQTLIFVGAALAAGIPATDVADITVASAIAVIAAKRFLLLIMKILSIEHSLGLFARLGDAQFG